MHQLKVNLKRSNKNRGEHDMKLPYILSGIIFTVTTSTAFATERYLLDFELIKNENIIEMGKLLISNSQHSWRKGLKQSYLKIRCVKQQSGEIQKSLSTEDFFAGLEISHQLHKNNVVLKIVHTDVQSRRSEIHALKKDECKAIAPIITTTKQTYSFQSIENVNQTKAFGESMLFQVNLKPMDVLVK